LSAEVELSIVIPVYGCRDCLGPLHRRIVDSASSITEDFEVVFVDDASPDYAWDELVRLADADPRVRAFGMSRNFGQDAAITAGLSHARGRWTVILDCDLQEPPEEIPRLYAKAMEGHDIVRTTRTPGGHSRLRTMASRGYRRLTLEHNPDTEYSNMSMLSRPVVDAFLSLNDRDREYTLVLDWLGFRQASVQIEHHERPTGRSSYTWRRLLGVALDGMFFRTTVLLRVVVFAGFLITAAGGILALYNIAYYFAGRQPVGYTSLLVLELLLSGCVITSVGVVGLYVGRIFEQVKYRPLFIISRQTGEPAEGRSASLPVPAARVPSGPPPVRLPGEEQPSRPTT
jgi:glycosyltransferase involved in cell wall biosynthesis